MTVIEHRSAEERAEFLRAWFQIADAFGRPHSTRRHTANMFATGAL